MKSLPLFCGFLCLVTVASAQSRHGDYNRSEPRVIIFENANFRGGSLVLYPGDRMHDLHHVRFDNGKVINDQISSIRVEGGVAIRLYDHEDFRGQVMRTTRDVRNLAYRRMPDSSIAWNDRITSLIVEGEHRARTRPRPADEPRRRPGPAVDPMIQRAYRAVLKRPADPKGLAYYRRLVTDQGWTDQMVRAHLRRSDEYKIQKADQIIHRAYRDILGRDPDPNGLATYRRLIVKEHWSERRLRKALQDSPEYRERHAKKERPRSTDRR